MRSIARRFVAPFAFVVFAVFCAMVMWVSATYTHAYAVTIDGDKWGIVKEEADIDNAVKTAENYIGEIVDDDSYNLDVDVSFEEVTVKKDDIGSTYGMVDWLISCSSDITDGYALKVDGDIIGVSNSAEELETIVDDVLESYKTEDTVDARIISDVEIEYDTVASDVESDADTITDVLYEPVEDEVTYTVQNGETFKDVVENTDADVTELIGLNPDLVEQDNELTELKETVMSDSDKSSNSDNNEDSIITEENNIEYSIAEDEDLQNVDEDINQGNIESTEDEMLPETPIDEGTVLTVAPEVRVLTVETTAVEKHEETISFDTETVEDDTLEDGTQVVEQRGLDGAISVSETVTYLNDTETSRVVSDKETIYHSIPEIIRIGTKETPEDTENIDSIESNNTLELTDDSSDNYESSIEPVQPEVSVSDNNSSENVSQTVTNNNISVSNAGSPNITEAANGTANSNTVDTNDSDTSYSESTVEAVNTSSDVTALRNSVVEYAKQFLGCSYAYAGHGPYVFDCSGLTGYVYSHFGYSLPWTVTGQYACGTYVPLDVSQMLPGDLIFWSYGGSTPTHVGMYIGNGQYIQATKPGDVVRINTVSSYPGQPLVGCRRIIN